MHSLRFQSKRAPLIPGSQRGNLSLGPEIPTVVKADRNPRVELPLPFWRFCWLALHCQKQRLLALIFAHLQRTASVATGDTLLGGRFPWLCRLPGCVSSGGSQCMWCEVIFLGSLLWVQAATAMAEVPTLMLRASRMPGSLLLVTAGMLGTSQREGWKPYQSEQPRLNRRAVNPRTFGPRVTAGVKAKEWMHHCLCVLPASYTQQNTGKEECEQTPLLSCRWRAYTSSRNKEKEILGSRIFPAATLKWDKK